MLCFRTNKNHKKFNDLILRASKIGLPTRFLKLVEKEICVSMGSSDRYSFFLNHLELTKSVIEGIDTISDSRRGLSDNSAIGTIYHEALHAYFDLQKDDKILIELLSEGKEHYAGGRLKNGFFSV